MLPALPVLVRPEPSGRRPSEVVEVAAPMPVPEPMALELTAPTFDAPVLITGAPELAEPVALEWMAPEPAAPVALSDPPVAPVHRWRHRAARSAPAEVPAAPAAPPQLEPALVALAAPLLVSAQPIQLPSVSVAVALPAPAPEAVPRPKPVPAPLNVAAQPDAAVAVEAVDLTAAATGLAQLDRPHADRGQAQRQAQPAPAIPWIRLTASATHDDRERLRNLLGWRYETHARFVNGVLALEPGLRTNARQDDILAGLVAVRAHLSGIGAVVDVLLRGEQPPADPSSGPGIDAVGAKMLARCAGSGLRRLPVMVGPVFRPGTSGAAVLKQYRSGTVLVEPAFTEARMLRSAMAGTTVEYAIWSSTGRRTDRLDGPEVGSGTPRVMFDAGSHFVVLGVEEPAGSGPTRVLLREISRPGQTDEQADERARQRLQETAKLAVEADTEESAHWQLPLGVRSDGTPFSLVEDVRQPA
jgi:hypothetical protein